MPPRQPRLFLLIRKIHLYLGLFFLVELWIFAVSGLFLNHPQWQISQFWDRREVTERALSLPPLSATEDEEKAHQLMEALEIEGELESLSWPSDLEGFRFNVVRPARITTITVNTAKQKIQVEKISTDWAGFLSMLHNFNGVDFENGGRTRDWFLTKLWTLIMDLLSVSLIIWVITGVYLWLATGARERMPGLVTLALGLGLALFFVLGPGLLF